MPRYPYPTQRMDDIEVSAEDIHKILIVLARCGILTHNQYADARKKFFIFYDNEKIYNRKTQEYE